MSTVRTDSPTVTHNSPQERKNVIRALCSNVRLSHRRTASMHHRQNVGEALRKYGPAQQYYWQLIDYRRENRRLASVILTHAEAADLNGRLQGSGLGFGRVG